MDIFTAGVSEPPLRRPVLVAAFEGWNDAGEAASTAALTLAGELDAEEFATIDPEEFYDFQATRPLIRTSESGERSVEWPRNAFSWARLPGADRDLVLLQGIEPSLRWRRFTAGVADLADRLGIELVITLGALQVDQPHTRPVTVTGTATDTELAEQLALRRSRYEGPTGIVGVLHAAFSAAGTRALTLWAGVPHYLAGAPYLPAVLALAERVGRVFEVTLPLERLADESAAQQREIAELVAEDAELAAYVAELEGQWDKQADELPHPTVSGDELAAEFERFLRNRRRD
jgi:proteasome assembly chaperone (PAC2) family protein